MLCLRFAPFVAQNIRWLGPTVIHDLLQQPFAELIRRFKKRLFDELIALTCVLSEQEQIVRKENTVPQQYRIYLCDLIAWWVLYHPLPFQLPPLLLAYAFRICKLDF